jgi:hypothetical protein
VGFIEIGVVEIINAGNIGILLKAYMKQLEKYIKDLNVNL